MSSFKFVTFVLNSYIQFSTRNGLNRRYGGDDRTGKS